MPAKAQEKHLEVGDRIPSFSLYDQHGKLFNSKDYEGKNFLVIYFYPKDESGVCTKESCAFRDSYADFTSAGAVVVGINSAPVATHKAFAEHHNFPFQLLSDPDNKVLRQFGVKNKFFMTGRETFVVDRQGKIVYAFNSMLNGVDHSNKTLAYLKEHSGK